MAVLQSFPGDDVMMFVNVTKTHCVRSYVTDFDRYRDLGS